MDIGAYAKINDLSTILASTGVNIPRLRGLRLMAMEERITEEEIKEMTASAEVDAVERVDDWCDSTYCDIYLKIDEKIVEKYLKKRKNNNKECMPKSLLLSISRCKNRSGLFRFYSNFHILNTK